MKTFASSRRFIALFALAVAALAGCESTDGGGSVHGSFYYGVGFYDPWYYGDYYDDPDIIVTPPDRPDRPAAHPEHPIAKPPPSASRPAPMPSMPSRPRPSGGRR